VTYGVLNRGKSDDLEWPSSSFTYYKPFQIRFFTQLCSSWQVFNWHSTSRGPCATVKLIVEIISARHAGLLLLVLVLSIFPLHYCIISHSLSTVRMIQYEQQQQYYTAHHFCTSYKHSLVIYTLWVWGPIHKRSYDNIEDISYEKILCDTRGILWQNHIFLFINKLQQEIRVLCRHRLSQRWSMQQSACAGNIDV